MRTHDSLRIAGRDVRYVATAGTLTLRDARDRPTASIFYIAYEARGLGPTARRPITFAFNGGPGVSSTSLNIGAFGPKVVSGLTVDRYDPAERLVDNASCLLDKTDLVFVDAVGTGYSRIEGVATAGDFFGVDEDAQAFTQFIRRYVKSNGRSASPKYLLGLSYGTTRSAAVADLLERGGTKLDGILLMSTVLDFPAISGSDGQDLRYSLELPTEAMIASYHEKSAIPANLMKRRLSEVRAFAAGPYALALARGDALPATERHRIALRLHAYLGLPVADIERDDLRVSPDRFAQRLLADRHATIGRYDGRVLIANVGSSRLDSAPDPSTTAESAAFAAVVPGFLRTTLQFVRNDAYVLTALDVNRRWNWGEDGPSGTNVTSDLADAMEHDSHLRIISLNGYYDLATPFFGTEYQLAHLGLSPESPRNIEFKYYAAGHMIFVDPKARTELKRDLDAFFTSRRRGKPGLPSTGDQRSV